MQVDVILGKMSAWMSGSFGTMLLNVAGYATILVPGYLIIRYVRSSGYLTNAGHGCFARLLRACIQGSPSIQIIDVESGGTATSKDAASTPAAAHQTKDQRTFCQTCRVMMFCAGGLLTSYLVWGLLQEQIMTQEYGANGERFPNSLFLEFSNRVLAVLLACGTLLVVKQPRHTAPIYKYSFCSLSNVMSGWCQYEALKYVSFPIQVLAKASKVIPVMLMGRLVTKQTYSLMEYITAAALSLGVFMFLLASEDTVRTDAQNASIYGIALLGGYLFFDAFTSNWQSQLFREHSMSSVQMMAGLNMFSVILTSVSLAEQGGFVEAATFMTRYPTFVLHVSALAVASAVGQLFIYYTISQFGAATFVIIMTIPQAFAILLSCIIYHHPVHIIGVVGIAVCFGAILVRVYHSRGHAHNSKAPPTDHRVTVELETGPPKQ